MIERVDGDEGVALHAALTPMALCSDAVVRAVDTAEGTDWQLVGDPTEGALVVLAAKGGVQIDELRAGHPRLADVPFDSANKFMVTVHEMSSVAGDPVVMVYAKGAPDVLTGRSAFVIGHDGRRAPIGEYLEELDEHNRRMADTGLRVIAVSQREFSPEAWSEFEASGADPIELAEQLTLVALVGIVDPPRAEARQAIAEAAEAGITVRMITGDHAATAAAIGSQLGLYGSPLTGADLDRLNDDELRLAVQTTAVFARVSPEHKLRLVRALQENGNVVAMTGDGVNDAPALKRADIGVAMGITGTEVSKEAATMVLADDNFATIVKAVRLGRTIYDNIVKFVRFQLSTTLGFAMLFLMAALFGIADGKPFTAIAILWVNLIMDGPPAMALGVDPQGRDVMQRPPRPTAEKILTRSRWIAVGLASTVMAAGTLAVLALAPGDPVASTATIAGTMAFNTFVLAQFFNILNARSDRQTVFSRDTFRNRALWWSLAVVLLLQVGVTHVGPMQRLFDTTSISGVQWLICVAVASLVLVADEIRKLIVRHGGRS
jgi:Ca2+-transporting ATPase